MGFSQVGIEGCDAAAALAAHQEALSADPATTKPQRPSCCRRTDVAGGEIGEVAGEAATREAALTGSPPKQGAVPSMTEVVS